MEQVRYAQAVASRMARRTHSVHPASEDTQGIGPKQVSSISACTASSGGQPPYLVKGLAMPFHGDSPEETPNTLGNRWFSKGHCNAQRWIAARGQRL
eukprot:5350968-Karenia_brevis.AAC.1